MAHWSGVSRRGALRGAFACLAAVGMVVAAVFVAAQVAAAGPPMRAASPAAKSRAAGASRWSIIPSPSLNPSAGYVVDLHAVSCVSATDCTAVGSGSDRSRGVEHWNGRKWSIAQSGEFGEVDGVSCVSATDCTAVGSGPNVEHWNGTKWSVVPSPNPRGARLSEQGLSAVSCVSATDCTAVGGGPRRTLVERWDGAAWSIVPSPSPSGGGLLSGVSCVSATDCTAVGNVWGFGHGSTYPKATLAEQWNGTKWSITQSTGFGELLGVSCVSATDCTAVGTRVEHWNGTKWSIVPASGPARLDGVSCVSATDCVAVGANTNGRNGENITRVEHWNGKRWSGISSTNPSGGGQLSGVWCVCPRHAASRSATTTAASGPWSSRGAARRIKPPAGPYLDLPGQLVLATEDELFDPAG